jgi:hypothetical protein
VLKGASMLLAWLGEPIRPTRAMRTCAAPARLDTDSLRASFV